MKDNEFHQEISKALAGCQQVEKELKDYIGIAFKAAQRQNLPYQPLTNDIEAMPLGKLISRPCKFHLRPLIPIFSALSADTSSQFWYE